MSLTDRMTRCPRPHDEERGAIARDAIGATGPLGDLVAGAAGSSPFLSGLVDREGDWLREAAEDPESAFDALLRDLTDGDDIARRLRSARRRVALIVALADLGGVWDLEAVTARLTRFADAALAAALEDAARVELSRNKLPGQGIEALDRAGGLAVIAMGKMGAFELNYSSDIDIIALFDETRFDPPDYPEARASFVRMVRRVAKTLSERTSDGYVLRTDLRLRPDASVTPVAMSMEAAENYYESFGRTWERAAWIKARAAAGDLEAGAEFIGRLAPFVWRRHLDFWTIRDADEMRGKIRREHETWARSDELLGRNLKLGPGGIREIEFFTQTRQLIAGGRDPSLRERGTEKALARLAAAGWIGDSDRDALAACYRFLREIEHRIQMIGDQQTHSLPSSPEDFDRIAALCGMSAADLRERLVDTLAEVEGRTDAFFEPDAPPPPPDNLPPEAEEITGRWPSYPALRSPRSVEIFQRVRPALLERLTKATDPKAALVHLDAFLAGLPAGVQVFSLFEANPQLLDLVIDIVDTAPGLARHLAQNAGVFDAVIGGDFFAPWPQAEALARDLDQALATAADYETTLDRARIWAREWRFRAGVHYLRGIADSAETGHAYASVARTVVNRLFPCVAEHFAVRHGPAPGRGAAVVGMGSLGSGWMTAGSDLDIIVIYDAEGVEASEGRRPLATRTYYARLTQALVTALSAPTAEGRLYAVDMRLRPSGRQGPVATGLDAFTDYQSREAWTWEHLALTHARAVAGAPEIGERVEAFRAELLQRPRDAARTRADVADMRARLWDAKPPAGPLDARNGPGRGQDVALFGEAAALIAGSCERGRRAQLEVAIELFGIDPGKADCLRRHETRLSALRQVGALVTEDGRLPETPTGGVAAFLLRETGAETAEELAERLGEDAATVAGIIDEALGPPRADDAEAG